MLLSSLLKQLDLSYLYLKIDEISQEIISFLSPTATGIGLSSRGGLIATRDCTTVKVWMLSFAD